MSGLPRSVTEQFAIDGAFQGASPLGQGHIHRTYRARYDGPGGVVRVVHQELNSEIFRDPEALMRNVARVCEHVRSKVRGQPDCGRRALEIIPTREGTMLHLDEAGRFWRTYRNVESTVSYDAIGSPRQAEATARAFARFVAQLTDLGEPPLETTIPHFHDTPKRFDDLRAAIDRDPLARVAEVGDVIRRAEAAFAWLEREGPRRGVQSLPRRVVHNDCKINNLLCDEKTGEPLCVIDLDTVMEGTVLFDFGELVRTSVCDLPEDAVDPEAMSIEPRILKALASGFVRGARAFITQPELEALPMAGALLAFENGIRFLADHLEGDRYFRIHREGQNLDRARAQLRLAELLIEATGAAEQAVREAVTG